MGIAIREFSTPNYAEHIPADDKEERTIQKIEKFATFLNELPWFGKKGTSPDTSSEEGIASGTAVTKKAADEAATKVMLEGADMGKLATADANADTYGVTPDMAVELQLMKNSKNADEFAKALEAAELKRIPISGELDQHNVIYKDNPEDVKAWQTKFGMTGKDVDGIWGKKTQAAYEKYIGG